MVAAVGLGTQLAINGAVALAFTNILYKTLLFMGTGAVLYATGKSKLTELGGLYKLMPAAFVLYMVGAVSISGFPLFSGFVSKGMVVYAAEVSHILPVFILLMIASVGTFVSVGLKLPYFTWFGKNNKLTVNTLPVGMYLGMGLTAFSCLFIGVYPAILYNILPYQVDYQPYTVAHLWETGSILIFTGLIFWLLVNKIKPKQGIILDFDWFYRRPAPLARKIFVDSPAYMFGKAEQASGIIVSQLVKFGANPVGRVVWYSKNLGKIITNKHQLSEEPYEFDPHRYRTPLGFMVIMVMLGFVVIALLSLLSGS